MSEVLKTFFAAWSDPDPGTALAACVGDSIYYVDPNTPEPINSVEALAEYLAMFTQHVPGASATVASVSEHHGHALAEVDFLNDGKPMMRGRYFSDLNSGGRIVRMIGFTGGDA